ncbi:elongation of very long chain fatty acids protein 7-like [Zerene cesonia]|uniref:elongation of very long chain fatty acids protein 7-like n=1 Tax=Zerene cesonia TaxID=33412 RepID=UPI0018E51284|nr:elongation of very long chain fatty acids protein 7-like [Zerene cesonia]XP_038210602.1 elongation of very long chain fatty acids protein 7-like [Zerene cesonia]
MSYLDKIDRYLDSLKVGKSAIVDSWFLMSSPIPLLAVVVSYLFFLKIGPRLMKNRPPLQITKLVSYYNAAQVVLAAMICIKVFKLNIFRDGIIYAGCRYPSNTQNPLLLDLGWWYFFAKFTELLDTVFFVLRKKDKQLTFLHVYHHVIMALYSWSYLKFAAGGEGAILALLNSAVHVVMYTYYLMSGLGPKFQKYLWWKKYVTKMQLIQFMLMLTYCAWTYYSPRCQYATGFTFFISSNVVIFLVLFLNFYTKSYKGRSDAKKQRIECAKAQNGSNDHLNLNGNNICDNNENGFCRSNGKMNLRVPYESVNGDNKNGKLVSRRLNKEVDGPDFNYGAKK